MNKLHHIRLTHIQLLFVFLLLSRYQKRIGTYDKQEWEKTVEQRILDGFNSINLKNTKLKTELIDVDLVRGILKTKLLSYSSL